MRRFNLCVTASLLSCLLLTLFFGCGPGKIENSQNRIKVYESQGVTDEMLSRAKVLIIQADTEKKYGNINKYRRQIDSVITYLDKLDEKYGSKIENAKTTVETLRAKFDQNKAQVSGYQLRTIDSMLVIIDSMKNKDWMLQALIKSEELDKMLPGILEDEKETKEIKQKIVGMWMGTRVPENKRFKAIEKKIYTFKKDNSIVITESKVGRTAYDLKEDWKYTSWGTYDVKADTIYMQIKREKCYKKRFFNLKGRKWVKSRASSPPYDSTFTDDHKNRYMTYGFMKENLKKMR